MTARFVTVVTAALFGCSAACKDVPASEVARIDATVEAAEPEPQSADSVNIADLGVNRGSPKAPVRVVELTDYGCGYCKKFHEETWPTLMREFVQAGKVQWKFLPFASGLFRNSTAATTAAECVLEQGDQLFETMDTLVWDAQREWKGASDPTAMLRGFAGEAGADIGRWDECMEQGRRADRVDAATAVARHLGVRGTPTFFVVGYQQPIQGALPTETFQQILTMVHEKAIRGDSIR